MVKRCNLLRGLRRWVHAKGDPPTLVELLDRHSQAVGSWSARSPEDRQAFDALVELYRAQPLPIRNPRDRDGQRANRPTDPGFEADLAIKGWGHYGGVRQAGEEPRWSAYDGWSMPGQQPVWRVRR
jgi:hypothetical protein